MTKSYLLSAGDFQDPKLPTLWLSQRTAVMLQEEDYPIFAARIDRLIFVEQEKAWELFDAPIFRISVHFEESKQKAIYKVEVIDGVKREDGDSKALIGEAPA